MSLLSLYVSFYSSLFKSACALVFARLYTPQPVSKRDLSGQTAIVTGANSGIGFGIAKQLASQGATVYLACRSLKRGDEAVRKIVDAIGESHTGSIYCWRLDTSDLSSVRAFCDRWARDREGLKIDMLVHNAGIAAPPQNTPCTTKDGKDLIIVTNFLGSFLMTKLLEPHLSDNARVVMTSSTGHLGSDLILRPSKPPSSSTTFISGKLNLSKSPTPSYIHSKAQQVLFALLLQRHFTSTGSQRSAHAFTPGFTASSIFSKFDFSWRVCLTSPSLSLLKVTEKYIGVDGDEGGKTGAWLAAEGSPREGGGYWEWCTRRTSLVDLMEGKLGEEVFGQRARAEWKGWEEDCSMEWNVQI
jgi:NAD(P)-dependent dehydrogenase (short-subunit alcohol dehydrogenase family)